MNTKPDRYTPQRTVNLDWLRSLSPAELRSWLWELLDGHDLGWIGRTDMTPRTLLLEAVSKLSARDGELVRDALTDLIEGLDTQAEPAWTEDGLHELLLAVGCVQAGGAVRPLLRMVERERWFEGGAPTRAHAWVLQAVAALDANQGFNFWRDQTMLCPSLCFAPAVSAVVLSPDDGVDCALELTCEVAAVEWDERLASIFGLVLELAASRIGEDAVDGPCRKLAESDSTPPALRETLRGWFAETKL